MPSCYYPFKVYSQSVGDWVRDCAWERVGTNSQGLEVDKRGDGGGDTAIKVVVYEIKDGEASELKGEEWSGSFKNPKSS